MKLCSDNLANIEAHTGLGFARDLKTRLDYSIFFPPTKIVSVFDSQNKSRTGCGRKIHFLKLYNLWTTVCTVTAFNILVISKLTCEPLQ